MILDLDIILLKSSVKENDRDNFSEKFRSPKMRLRPIPETQISESQI